MKNQTSIDLRKELHSGDKVHFRCGGDPTVIDVRYIEGTDVIQVYFLEPDRSSPMIWFVNGSFEFNKGHPLDIIKVTSDHRPDLKLDDLEEMNNCLDSMYWRQQKISGELRDALYEILDQVKGYTGPMPTMIREIAKQVLGEKEEDE